MFQDLVNKAVIQYLRKAPLDRGKWRLLHASAKFLVVELEPGVRVRIANPQDSIEKAIVYGWKERAEAERFLSLARPGMTAFDIGANLGLYSLLLAKRVGPAGRVHAFEPTPRIVAKLQANIELNRLTNIEVNPVAVSSSRGTAQFFLHPDDDQSSLAAVSGEAITVPTITLDDYIVEHQIQRVDLLKIDVEGAEVHALSGAKGLFSGPHPPTVLMEINPPALTQMGSSAEVLEALMRDWGYRSTVLAQHEGYRNVLLTHPKSIQS